MGNRRFGFECELASGARNVIAELHANNLAGMGDLHSYHCHCSDCRHNDVEASGGPLFRGQEDCTVDGEIISSILTHGTDSAERAFSALSSTLLKMRADVDDNAGFHVHVDKTDLTDLDKLRALRIYMRYQHDGLDELASAREGDVRAYNRPVHDVTTFVAGGAVDGESQYTVWGRIYRNCRPENWADCYGRPSTTGCCNWCRSNGPEHMARRRGLQAEWDRVYGAPVAPVTVTPTEQFWTDDTLVVQNSSKGSWLNSFGAGNGDKTFEFRLWNATRVEWRMRLAVGVSVAIMDAAKAGVHVKQDDPRVFEDVVGDFLTDDTWAAIIRQRSFKDVA